MSDSESVTQSEGGNDISSSESESSQDDDDELPELLEPDVAFERQQPGERVRTAEQLMRRKKREDFKKEHVTKIYH